MSDTATAPAPAPSAPTAPPTIVPVPQGFNDRIRSIANKTTIPAAPVVDTSRVEIIRTSSEPRPDASGSRDAPAGSGPTVQQTIDALAIGGAPAAVSASAPPIVEPSGELSIDDGEMTLSAQRNADGTFKTKFDPNEKLDFTVKSEIDPATGKPKLYSKTLPEIARMAKESITLQRTQGELTKKLSTIEPEVTYYREHVPKWQEETTSLRTQLDNMTALNRELLSEPDEIVIQRREQYKAEMSPEKQLERLKAERAAELAERDKTERQKQQEARKAQHDKIATSFMGSRIAPALTAAEQIVSPEAVTGKVTMLTQDLVVNGVIPPANWPEMEARITSPTGPFQTWLQAESAKRTNDSDAVRKATEAAEAERRRAQQVVNETGRTMVPIGRAGPESAPQPVAKTDSVQERINRIVRKPLPDAAQRSA